MRRPFFRTWLTHCRVSRSKHLFYFKNKLPKKHNFKSTIIFLFFWYLRHCSHDLKSTTVVDLNFYIQIGNSHYIGHQFLKKFKIQNNQLFLIKLYGEATLSQEKIFWLTLDRSEIEKKIDWKLTVFCRVWNLFVIKAAFCLSSVISHLGSLWSIVLFGLVGPPSNLLIFN